MENVKMNAREMIDAMEMAVCDRCEGSGIVHDAEPGDIGYRSYRCSQCGGDGWDNKTTITPPQDDGWIGQEGDNLQERMIKAANLLDVGAFRINKLEAEAAELKREVEALEQLRPHWAEGYTSDSVAAQIQAAALSEIWKVLGVNNQSDAMERLREIIPDSA